MAYASAIRFASPQFTRGTSFPTPTWGRGTDGSGRYYILPPTPFPGTSGLVWSVYAGASFPPFNSAAQTPALVGLSTTVDLTPPGLPSNDFAMEWSGYFKPDVTGVWQFRSWARWTHGMWMGWTADSAVGTYTSSNNAVSWDSGYAGSYSGGSIALTAGVYYKLRIQFVAVSGSNTGIFFSEFARPGAAFAPTNWGKGTDGTGLFFTSPPMSDIFNGQAGLKFRVWKLPAFQPTPFFMTAPPPVTPAYVGYVSSVDTTTLTGVPAEVSSLTPTPNLAMDWAGVFRADVSGVWTFRYVCDDSFAMWLGQAALMPTAANFLYATQQWVAIGSWVAFTSGISLSAGVSYPMLVQTSNSGGGGYMQLQFRRPGNATWVASFDGLTFPVEPPTPPPSPSPPPPRGSHARASLPAGAQSTSATSSTCVAGSRSSSGAPAVAVATAALTWPPMRQRSVPAC